MKNSKLKTYLVLILTYIPIITLADSKPNVDKEGVILKGYDVVSYFGSKGPEKANTEIKTHYNGAIYLFVNEANKKEFLKNPEKYVPKYDGWCAYAVADSKSKVDIDPKTYLIQDGHLLVFYNGIWGNTLNKWNKDPKKFQQQAEDNWPKTKNEEP